MSVILMTLGILLALAGLGAIGFGISINELPPGTTLLVAGTTAFTGGLVLIGLSAVVTELGRVAEGLKARPAVRPVIRASEAPEPTAVAAGAAAPAVGVRPAPPLQQPPPPVPHPAAIPAAARPRPEAPAPRAGEPHPAAPSTVEVSAAAIERLRSSIPRTERPRADAAVVADLEEVPLSPNGAAHHPAPRTPSLEVAPPEPKVTAQDRTGGAGVESAKTSRLDFLFRARAARPAPQPENFEAFWPADGRPGRGAEAEAPARAEEAQRPTDYASSAPPPPIQERRPAPADSVPILKSGVVDGMAYTLYADGSIEAKLPQGTVRFGSIAELRAHIESSS